MLFDSLDKLRRNSIMSAVLLIALGAVILICPQQFIGSLMLAFGYVLIIIGIVMMLNFFTSKKSIMDYLKLALALIMIIVGMCVLVFREDVLVTLTWLFSFLLVLDGLRTLYHSFTYARRSQRKGWWILSILSVLLIAGGVILFLNQWFDTPEKLMKVIGCAVMFSATVSAIRLIWTRPLQKTKESDKNAG